MGQSKLKGTNAGAGKTGEAGRKSPTKRELLGKLLSKPGGAKVSLLQSKLGWQNHTVRAAISGLRKSGVVIVREQAKPSGETMYRIVADVAATDVVTSSVVSA